MNPKTIARQTFTDWEAMKSWIDTDPKAPSYRDVVNFQYLPGLGYVVYYWGSRYE